MFFKLVYNSPLRGDAIAGGGSQQSAKVKP